MFASEEAESQGRRLISLESTPHPELSLRKDEARALSGTGFANIPHISSANPERHS